MDRLMSSICLIILFSASLIADGYSIPRSDADDELLIRQVVSDADVASEKDEAVLGAEGHFASFLKTYGKSYATPAEHSYRFSVFKANLRRARRHQLMDPSAVHGITQFSDLTPEEFERNYLGLHRRKPTMFSKVGNGGAHEAPLLPTSDLPQNFDWRDHGAVTPVKNQVGRGRSLCIVSSYLLRVYGSLLWRPDCRALVDLAGLSAQRGLWKGPTFWRREI